MPDEPSEDAARGTVKHVMGQMCLETRTDAVQFLGRTFEADGFKFEVTQEFVDQVQTYVDNCRRDVGNQQYEVHLDTSSILGVPGQGGTADCVTLYIPAKMIKIRDAKFGFERISARKNLQLMIYLAAAMEAFDFYEEWEGGQIIIDQPPIHHYDESEIITVQEVRDFIDFIRPRAKLAYAMYMGEIPVQLVPGPTQCKWCPIRRSCPARTKAVNDMFGKDSDEPPIPTLTDEDIAGVLASGVVEFVESWVKDIRQEALTRALAGRKLPGFKLARGRKGDRFFTDPEKVVGLLNMVLDPEELDKMYEPRKLKSPTVLQKLNKAAYSDVKEYVDQSQGALKLVPEDSREAEVERQNVEFGSK